MADAPTSILDTHIHLRHPDMKNPWLDNEGPAFNTTWNEAGLVAAAEASNYKIEQAVFVECCNDPPLDEAKWVLSLVDDAASVVAAVVAHIPAPDGAEATKTFLDGLRGADGKLPSGLKGARCVFLGPDAKVDKCLDAKFHEGLAVLEAEGLHWEICCHPPALPSVAKMCASLPKMNFVLNHAGHNGKDEGFEVWAAALKEVAANKNIVCKPGAIEEWDVEDAAPYLDTVIACFGFDRIIAESNWFVSAACGATYGAVFDALHAACVRAGASAEQISAVFSGNAKRVYRL